MALVEIQPPGKPGPPIFLPKPLKRIPMDTCLPNGFVVVSWWMNLLIESAA